MSKLSLETRIQGSLAGSLNGAEGVPGEWIAMLSHASMERIDKNAARLTELISVKKWAHLQARRNAAGGKA